MKLPRKHRTDKELTAFMRSYTQANNSHVFAKVAPHIAKEATYWFTDGSYRGMAEIRAAIEATFTKIRDEVYDIDDLRWIVVSDDTAVCTYRFSWRGTIDEQRACGSGRGTNVLRKSGDTWEILHEHLST